MIDITSPRTQWQNVGNAYRVDARIVVHSVDNAVTVPVTALFRDGAQWAVFVAENSIARKRVIETSRRGVRAALVEKGLAPGDAVRDGRGIAPRTTKSP